MTFEAVLTIGFILGAIVFGFNVYIFYKAFSSAFHILTPRKKSKELDND